MFGLKVRVKKVKTPILPPFINDVINLGVGDINKYNDIILKHIFIDGGSTDVIREVFFKTPNLPLRLYL